MNNKVQIDEICIERVKDKEMVGLYQNATARYLGPCLSVYGRDFSYWMNNIYKVGVGIGDIIVNRCGLKFEKHIFILVDVSKLQMYFKGFISWIREQSMYEEDYVYGDIRTSSIHMVVIKFPEQFYSVLEPFRLGEYSKMYTQEQIDTLFKDFPGTKRILVKDHNYRVKFVNRLNKDWNSDIKPEEWDGELDLPPERHKNIFNTHINDIN